MLTCTGSSLSRLVPFAATPVKLTEPKLVSGRTLEPPEVFEGASAMASAEDRSAPVWVALIVCVQPCVLSSRLTGFAKFTPAPRIDLVPGRHFRRICAPYRTLHLP
jgi:hypothetical protein